MLKNMTTSLFKVISSIMNIKRWNMMPQIETWNEAENIAFYTHMAYAIAKEGFELKSETMEKLLTRCLLKSLNKHILSDISIKSRDKMRTLDPNIWSELINETAKQIASNFPRIVSKEFNNYLTYEGDYEISDTNIKKDTLENLIKYCQYRTALEECATNMKVFDNIEYQKFYNNIILKINSIPQNDLDIFNNTYDKVACTEYFETIKRLKNLLRWNRVVRSNESTVMGHTFVVSLLTVVFVNMEACDSKLDVNFKYRCILKALFHDLLESLTGDVITPVKDIINKKRKGFWTKVEKRIVEEFSTSLPQKIKEESKKFCLFDDFDDKLYSIDSIVKACDQLALIFECLYEREWGSNIPEMNRAYENYTAKLQNSEWASIREFSNSILVDFPK